jgi:hypothetical protein
VTGCASKCLLHGPFVSHRCSWESVVRYGVHFQGPKDCPFLRYFVLLLEVLQLCHTIHRVKKTSGLYDHSICYVSGRSRVEILAQNLAMPRPLCFFPQYLPANAAISPEMYRSRRLPSILSPIPRQSFPHSRI